MSVQGHDLAGTVAPVQAPLRPPSQVMRLARMGAFFPTRLSFMRSLLRHLAEEGAQVERPVFDIDAKGYGHAVYSVRLGGHAYSLVAFSTPLDPALRTDRVIAEAWDTSYVLFDGIPAAHDIDRLRANTPLQEAGRFRPTELVLSRANKSVRLFEHVVERLAAGHQPDLQQVLATGYLMRTTAVYGNGKFGVADRARICERSGLGGPFQAEMLTVWLIRGFTHDLVEHVARARNPDGAVTLDRQCKRYLGIGNATGLGMAPFLVNHPVLLNNWMQARETALARVRAIEAAHSATIERVIELLERATRHVAQWHVDDARQAARIDTLRDELSRLQALVTPAWLDRPAPWEQLMSAAQRYSLECQELVVALLLEPHGELVDGLTHCMASSTQPRLEPAMPISGLVALIEQHFDWALAVDFNDPAASHRFWYVSQEKLEPRLGERFAEPGADREMPLDIARQVQALHADAAEIAPSQTVAEFVLRHPVHRHAIRRVQSAVRHPYSEIRDNLIGERCLAIDMLRCKLSFFGAAKFDPKSDRWTRITLYQGAPLADELSGGAALTDDWWLPVLEVA